MALGAGLGAMLLVGWALLDSLWLFYAVWIAIGVTHAMCLSDPAYAVVTGVTWTRQSGCSVCSQLSTHSQTVAAPEDVVVIR